MRFNAILFWLLSVFFGLLAVVYASWSLLEANGINKGDAATGFNSGGSPGIEWVGVVGLSLGSILGAFLGFYLQRSYNAQGGELPEDRLDANIDDGDPELGFFSPWSWWPIVLAGAAALGFLGLAVGFWIAFIGVGLFLVAITGWVYEYYRGYFAR
jgi:hypothetical protein